MCLHVVISTGCYNTYYLINKIKTNNDFKRDRKIYPR